MTETRTAPVGGLFRQLPYIKLALILLAALLLPLLGAQVDDYVWEPLYFHGGYSHTIYTYGSYARASCLLLGVLGLTLGLIWPRLSLWVGVASRPRAAFIYGCLLLTAVLVDREMAVLGAKQSAQAMSDIAALYEKLSADQTAAQLDAAMQTTNPNLRRMPPQGRVTLAGLPLVEKPVELAQLGFPSLLEQNYVLAELTGPAAQAGTTVKRVLLVRNDHIVASKPALSDTDPQVLAGTITQGPGALNFFPCQSALPARVGKIAPAAEETLAHNLGKNGRGTFVIAEGVVHPDPDCKTCNSERRSMEIFAIRETREAGPGVCDKPH